MVVAGDVYDRAIPPVEAVTLLSDTLAQLAEHTTVIVTSGNHDSATRLGFGAGADEGHACGCAPASRGWRRPWCSPDERAGLRHPVPRPRLRARGARRRPGRAARPVARGRDGGGDAADPRRRRARAGPAPRRWSPRTRSCMGGAADRVRAGHPGRRRRPRARRRVRGRRLRRARAPARPAGAQRARTARCCGTAGSPLAYSFSEQHHAKSTVLVDLSGPTVSHVADRRAGPAPARRRDRDAGGAARRRAARATTGSA